VHFARPVVRANAELLMLTGIAVVLIVLSIAILVAHAVEAFR
jgi:Na+-transporting methylmalonyl-CoA/oxaloacetate decarboxylase gamma subunit